MKNACFIKYSTIPDRADELGLLSSRRRQRELSEIVCTIEMALKTVLWAIKVRELIYKLAIFFPP